MEQPKTLRSRSRVPNFTSDEKILLGTLIKGKPIVESKLTDGKSVQKKKAAWESITQEFNCQAHVHKRDTLTLKRAWDNMKATTRKARAAERGNIFKTGGGPPMPPQSQQQGAIISMVEEAAPVLICEIKNPYDSDGNILTSLDVDDCGQIEPTNHMINDNTTVTDNNKEKNTLQSYDILTEELPIEPINETVSQECNEKENFPLTNVPRKPADYVRREGVLRLKHFEMKKRVEMNLLHSKLATQEIQKQSAELELETREIQKQSAELELERNKILLEKSKLELEALKNSLLNKKL